MKRMRYLSTIAVLAILTACGPRERMLVLLSTNDMHAKIERFAQLAAAVEACRDTAQIVMLVDAGDRWTGNAFVDRVEVQGLPIVELMNRLRYDVVTSGNHEFDFGQAHLGRMIDSMDARVVCANLHSDTATFAQPPAHVLFDKDGVRIGFVGVITNYEGDGYPAGRAESFRGLTFSDPQQVAEQQAAELRAQCDVLVLLSHMGDNRDKELLERGGSSYDVLIGGHTHAQLDTLIDGTRLTQTGKDLLNVGVTTIRLKGRKIVSIASRLVSLEDYAPAPEYQRQVDVYFADPELNRTVGALGTAMDKSGLANWMARSVADAQKAEVGFYHVGGVRLDTIPAGDVRKAVVYGLEPFQTQIATMRMSVADMRRMVICKFNDTVNAKESHRVDLVSTTPYTILTDAAGNAVDVVFPLLREGRAYRVAMSDYSYNNYKGLHYTDGQVSETKVEDVLFDDLAKHSPLKADNTPRQTIRQEKTK